MSRARFLGWHRRSEVGDDATVPAAVQELEQELRRALSVEPSPEFAAKVHARIAQPASASGRRTWHWAAAAVCILTLALGWRLTGRPGEEITAVPPALASADVRLEREPPPAARPQRPARPTHDRRRVTAAAIPIAPPQPRAETHVVVPPGNVRALTKLLALVRSGGVDEESLRPAVPPAAPVTLDVAPIVVPAISVPPLEIDVGAPNAGGLRE